MSGGHEVADTTDGCRYCWMCRQACPVGHVMQRETLTPHGWGMLIASEKRGVVSWTPEVADVIYSCADCGLCQAHCATGQPLPDAIAAARAAIAAAGAAPAAVYALHERLASAESARGGASARAAVQPGETALFAGDGGGAEGAATLDAAVKLLEAVGIRPVVIGDGRSNGLLASSLGFPDTARAQAEAVMAEVEATGCRALLVLGPGDRFAFERLYGERLGLTWPSQVVVREVTAVLADALDAGRLTLRQEPGAPPFAYHDPCHAPRVTRDHQAPRALLRAVLGAKSERRLFWREGRAHPCGAVGGLEFTQPAIAARLAAARFADTSAAGAARLVTEDAGCLAHLRRASPDGVEVLGLYEVLLAGVQA